MEEKSNTSNKSEYIRLATAVIVLFAIAGIFILYASWPLLTGKTIMLETKPIDPLDLIRGQYLIINYNINTIPTFSEAKPGQQVYVSLEENSKGFWEYKSVSFVKPSGTFILGKIISVQGNNMRVEYGIEQYFIERDSRTPTRNLEVEVRVARDGKARISKINFEGEPLQIEYKNLSITS